MAWEARQPAPEHLQAAAFVVVERQDEWPLGGDVVLVASLGRRPYGRQRSGDVGGKVAAAAHRVDQTNLRIREKRRG